MSIYCTSQYRFLQWVCTALASTHYYNEYCMYCTSQYHSYNEYVLHLSVPFPTISMYCISKYPILQWNCTWAQIQYNWSLAEKPQHTVVSPVYNEHEQRYNWTLAKNTSAYWLYLTWVCTALASTHSYNEYVLHLSLVSTHSYNEYVLHLSVPITTMSMYCTSQYPILQWNFTWAQIQYNWSLAEIPRHTVVSPVYNEHEQRYNWTLAELLPYLQWAWAEIELVISWDTSAQYPISPMSMIRDTTEP